MVSNDCGTRVHTLTSSPIIFSWHRPQQLPESFPRCICRSRKRYFGLICSQIPSEAQLSNYLLSMEPKSATVSLVAIVRISSAHVIVFQEIFGCRRHCTMADMALGPHILCNDITVLLRTGQSSEDLDSETLASVKEHIRYLQSEIVARDEHLQTQATSVQRERDLTVQDLENHESIFAPIRRLLNDVLLYIFQMSIDDRINLDVKTSPWLLGYICHHWRALSRSSPSLWADVSFESVCSSNLPFGRHSMQASSLTFQKCATQDQN